MSALGEPSEAEIDRARELASIGAGHAASALAGITGRTCEMRVPSVQSASLPESDLTGVLFELTGGTGGVLALFFPVATRDRLLEHLLGPSFSSERATTRAHSALCEVGNILASHAVNAVGEMVGETMLPSPPRLALTDAPAALANLLALRHGEEPGLRIQTEIFDRAGELRGIFVFVPDMPLRFAPATGF
jgi:chemotaxis protein CheC